MKEKIIGISGLILLLGIMMFSGKTNYKNNPVDNGNKTTAKSLINKINRDINDGKCIHAKAQILTQLYGIMDEDELGDDTAFIILEKAIKFYNDNKKK